MVKLDLAEVVAQGGGEGEAKAWNLTIAMVGNGSASHKPSRSTWLPKSPVLPATPASTNARPTIRGSLYG